jgi:hypothetical protein
VINDFDEVNFMDKTNRLGLEFYGGPIDGLKFFCRSPFRSRHFLTATAICLACETYILITLHRQWPLQPKFAAVGLGSVAILVALVWISAYNQLQQVREIMSANNATEVDQGSPLHITLGITATVTINMIYSTTMAAGISAFVIDRILIYVSPG